MPTSIIDGTLLSTELRRARGQTSVFRTIILQPDGGEPVTFTNAVVKQPVSDALIPGTRGRFYLYNAFDQKGLHGLRTADGRALYGFANQNSWLFLALGLFNLLWIVVLMAFDDRVPMLGVAMLVLATLGFIFMRKGERDAKAQFDGDAGYRPPGS